MAVRQEPKVTNYSEFKAKSFESGVNFTYITGKELREKIPASNLFNKITVMDDEAFFIYEARGLMMVARCIYLEVQNSFIPKGRKGAAKVYIVDMESQDVVYASKMFYRRSRRFWSDLGNYAYIAKLKIVGRPICGCLKDMNIVFRVTNQVYWVCRERSLHRDNQNVTLQWDIGIAKVFTDFLKIARMRNRKYLKKLSKLIKEFGIAPVRKTRL